MANPRVPIAKVLACTNADANKPLGADMGAVYIKNLDAANDVWITLDGTVAVAADQDGQIHLAAGASINLDDVIVSVVHGICSGVLTAKLQIVCTPRSGNSSGGAQ